MEKFSKKEAIKFGWSAMKSNFWFFVKFLIIAGLIYIIPDIILALIKDPTISTLLVVRSFEWVLYLFLSIGLINIALRIYDEKKAELSDLFSQ